MHRQHVCPWGGERVRHIAVVSGLCLFSLMGGASAAPAVEAAGESPASPPVGCKPEDIEAGVSSAARDVTWCYERGLQAGRAFSGRLDTRFFIEADGHVGRVAMDSVGPGDAPFRSCLAEMLQKVRFVAPVGGKCLIKYPFVFNFSDTPPGPALSGPVARVGGVEVVAPGEGPRFEAIRHLLTVTRLMKDGEAQARQAMARELIEDELLRQHAAHEGVVAPPAAVEAEFARLRARFASETDLDAFAKRVAGGRAELRAGLALRLTLDALYQKNRDLPLSPTLRDAVWAASPALWARPESAEVEHIFVAVPPKATPAELEAAQARLATIRSALAVPGADFAALARKHSDAPSAFAGGALGRVVRDQLVGPIDQVVFTAPLGVVSEPVRHSAGFHLVRVLRRDPARTADVAELERESPGLLAARHRRLARAGLVRSLAPKATIELPSAEAGAALPRLGASPWLVPDELGPDSPDWPFPLAP